MPSFYRQNLNFNIPQQTSQSTPQRVRTFSARRIQHTCLSAAVFKLEMKLILLRVGMLKAFKNEIIRTEKSSTSPHTRHRAWVSISWFFAQFLSSCVCSLFSPSFVRKQNKKSVTTYDDKDDTGEFMCMCRVVGHAWTLKVNEASKVVIKYTYGTDNMTWL